MNFICLSWLHNSIYAPCWNQPFGTFSYWCLLCRSGVVVVVFPSPNFSLSKNYLTNIQIGGRKSSTLRELGQNWNLHVLDFFSVLSDSTVLFYGLCPSLFSTLFLWVKIIKFWAPVIFCWKFLILMYSLTIPAPNFFNLPRHWCVIMQGKVFSMWSYFFRPLCVVCNCSVNCSIPVVFNVHRE